MEDISRAASEGVDGYDLYGRRVRIFLDPVTFCGLSGGRTLRRYGLPRGECLLHALHSGEAECTARIDNYFHAREQQPRGWIYANGRASSSY